MAVNFFKKIFGGKAVAQENPHISDGAAAGSGKTGDEYLVSVLFADFDNEDVLKLFPELAQPLANRQTDEIVRILREKTKTPESRKALLAWHELRKYGVFPETEAADKVLGAVVEVSLERGVDYLAAYPDHAARYFNQRGAKIYYECAEYSHINAEIDKLLRGCETAVRHFCPINEKRQPPLSAGTGQARINILTPGGTRAAADRIDNLQSGEFSKDIMAQAVVLMRALMRLSA
jgi:hypothetical protein